MAKRVTKGNLWGFIQSRPYTSVADIRRMFMMDVDGAALVSTSEGACYVGLPQDTADLIRQLWQEGRIALDMNPDVKARVVQGVYPARVSTGRRLGRPSREVPAASGRMAVLEPGLAPDGVEVERPAGTDTSRRRRRRKRRSANARAASEPLVAGLATGRAAPAGRRAARVRPSRC